MKLAIAVLLCSTVAAQAEEFPSSKGTVLRCSTSNGTTITLDISGQETEVADLRINDMQGTAVFDRRTMTLTFTATDGPHFGYQFNLSCR